MNRLFSRISALKVLSAFLENPYQKYYVREIARKLNMPKSTVSLCLQQLHREGFIERSEDRMAVYFKASLTPKLKAFKAAYTSSLIEHSGTMEYLSKNSKGLSSILLYGSAARGEDGPESDYDFLVIAAECTAKPLRLSELLGREVNLQHKTASEWKRISRDNRAFYLEVITSSMPLYGNKPVID